jgi:metallo-beta-lactamase family protein
MNVTLYGAAEDVTGSAYHLQTDQANVLVDCGLFQGGKMAEEKNRRDRALKAKDLDAILITHAHLDHTGRLPCLAKTGFTGPIFATQATTELAALILRDSAKVQAQDLERTNRKRQRAGKPLLDPLYSLTDVEATLPLFRPVPYDQSIPVAPGISAQFVEAGHLLGSASILLTVESGPRKTTVVFSGDLGPKGAPILKDPSDVNQANVVFLESTYGDHDHRPLADTIAEFEDIVIAAVRRKGKILVPTFAVGRAQLLLYLLALMFRQKKVEPFPIFVDSPMAIEATKIYQHHPELADEESTELNRQRPIESDLRTVKTTVTADESRALNDQSGPCLILAGAGMCNAGRIVHHLRQNLWRPETHVLIVGYQAEGTLGRLLVDGKKVVSIFGEKVAVKANIRTLGGFSAHAGQSDLLRWFDHMAHCRPRVILTHGETDAREALAQIIQERYGLKPEMPKLEETIEL